jgi:hypothetical protein
MGRRGALRILVGGFLGLTPAGGVTWDYIQWPLGFSMLGHEVIYVEDTRLWPVYQQEGPGNCMGNVSHVRSVMEAFGLAGCWAYRDEVSGECYGLTPEQLKNFCRSADVFVNLSCSTYLRDEYRSIPVRALVDSDPMFTQVQYCNGRSITSSHQGMRDMFEGHTHCFTFGENIGKSDCRIPECGITWHPIRQPICLPYWPIHVLTKESPPLFTTVMNWTATQDLTFNGETWGQKNVELMRFLDVPNRAEGIHLAIAVGQTTGCPFPAALFRQHGWTVLNPNESTPDWNSYRAFLASSFGEFSVAKETYTKARAGWFSCRSACYLASGRPVVAQETGWSAYIPTGVGLFTFSDTATAVDALVQARSDPGRHSRAARKIAEEFFSSDKVLRRMLRDCT